jgi:undecaprenyl-diphosphatase
VPRSAEASTATGRGLQALVLACAAVFVLLAVQVVLQGPFTTLDRTITLWLAAHRTPGLTSFTATVSDLHQTAKLLALTALLALWRGWRRDGRSVRALAVVPVGMLLIVALKDLFQRPRPHLDVPLVQIATYSFPSGHAVASTVFYGILCVLVFRHVRARSLRVAAAAVAGAMVLLVAFTRVYLGAHYLSDVLAGIAVGTICVALCWRVVFLRPA